MEEQALNTRTRRCKANSARDEEAAGTERFFFFPLVYV